MFGGDDKSIAGTGWIDGDNFGVFRGDVELWKLASLSKSSSGTPSKSVGSGVNLRSVSLNNFTSNESVRNKPG